MERSTKLFWGIALTILIGIAFYFNFGYGTNQYSKTKLLSTSCKLQYCTFTLKAIGTDRVIFLQINDVNYNSQISENYTFYRIGDFNFTIPFYVHIDETVNYQIKLKSGLPVITGSLIIE